MNINLKKILSFLFIFALCQTQTYASPWSKKEGYLNQTGGKFTHGLKHSLFSWMTMWTESREPGYEKQWEGFSVGIGKTVVYTAGGLIQLATFPIPADFPDFGIGMHIASKQCPMRHAKDYVPPSKDPLSKKAAEQTAAQSTPAKPALKPLRTPSTVTQEPALEPVVMEVKTAGAPVPVPSTEPVTAAEAVKKAISDAEKAQEAELAALALAAARPVPAVEETAQEEPLEYDIESEEVTNPVPAKEEEPEAQKPVEESFVLPEQKADDKAPLSNEDIVSVAPKAAEGSADEELWDEEESDKDSLDDMDEDLESDEDLDEFETDDADEAADYLSSLE